LGRAKNTKRIGDLAKKKKKLANLGGQEGVKTQLEKRKRSTENPLLYEKAETGGSLIR